MRGFSLEDNPFALLGLSPRARLQEIEDAFEDAIIASPIDELRLLRMKQELLTPNARLAAELSWLPELAPNRATELFRTLKTSDADRLLITLAELPPVSAANIAADSAERLADHQFIVPLILAHQELNSETTLALLNSTRAAAGFPRIDRNQYEVAVQTLRQQHARAALLSIVEQADPPAALTFVIEELPDDHDPTLQAIVREYDNWSAPHLGQIELDIDHALDQLTNGGRTEVNQLTDLLASWDRLSQPAQVFSQLSGLDEERTLRIYRKVRAKCIDLANEDQRFTDARIIAEAMKDLFEELPTANAQLNADLLALSDLSEQQEIDKALAPLTTAIEAAKANITRVSTDLSRFVFGSAQACPEVQQVYIAFIECRDKLAGGTHADAPIRLLRNFALDLNNEHDSAPAAATLLEGMQKFSEPRDDDLRQSLNRDLKTLRNNRDQSLLTAAIEGENWTPAIELIDKMLPRVSNETERTQLRELQATLQGRRTSRNWKRAGWAAVALFIVYTVVQEGNNHPSTNQSASTIGTPSTDDQSPSSQDTWTNAEPNSTTATDTAEAPPPVGEGLTLNAEQVKYCVFEDARLKSLSSLIDNTNGRAVDGYNSRVEDYNSRCSSFKYRTRDFTAANAALANAETQIATEVREIADGLSQ
jgi:hypothetical protein